MYLLALSPMKQRMYMYEVIHVLVGVVPYETVNVLCMSF